MTCATGKMVCATRQNDVRSWQNDVRAISDVTDVLGKMMCALMCALVCALMCAPVAGVPVAQRISFSSDEQSKVYKVLQPFLWRGGQFAEAAPLAICPYAPHVVDRSHFTSSPPWRVIGARNASIYLITLTDAPFLGGDLRWPNGPWPGEKIPYFTAKTGHMARHGIWPSDRLCLRWAGWVKSCHGLVRCGRTWAGWPRRVRSWRAG